MFFWKISQYWQRQRARQHWLAFIIGLLTLTAGLAMLNGVGKVDRLITDTATRFDTRTPSPEIVIITIDDDSIQDLKQEYGQWPWPRSVHATLLDQLKESGVRVIGFDIMFTEPDKDRPQEDMILAEAIKRNSPIIFPLAVYSPLDSDGRMEILKPIARYEQHAAALGHINMEPDTDGVARSIFLREGRDGVDGGVWNHFAVELWRVAQNISESDFQQQTLPGTRADAKDIEALEKIQRDGANQRIFPSGLLFDNWMLISFAGPPGSFQRYSYRDVFAGMVTPEQLKDKYVLIGATATGLGDAFATPISGQNALMPGVEIIANVLDGFIQSEFRYKASWPQNVIFNLLPMLCAFPLFYFGRARAVLFGCCGLMLLSLILTFLLRRYAGVQVAPAASLICLALSYPLWSWRRLEQAMKHIMVEFTRMRRENGFFQAAAHTTGDRLERDLQAFENAAWQLRDLQQIVRQSLDELPYAMLLTNENAQIILSNTEARNMFRVNPPLPTMAFEPAFGHEGSGRDAPILAQHTLTNLLSPRFLASLLSQQNYNHYAKSLLQFLQQNSAELEAGTIEVSDTRDGRPYLLKIVQRIMTIERSQGWLVTLVNMSGEQRVEIQRDQMLRYLQDNVCEQLDAMLEGATDPSGAAPKSAQQNIISLRSQVSSFLDFEYAQTAIYLYENLDLSVLLHDVFREVALLKNLPNTTTQSLNASNPIMIRGDAQILHKTLTELLMLTLDASGTLKMPQIRLSELENDNPEAIINASSKIQLFLVTALSPSENAAQKDIVFDHPIRHVDIPVGITPEIFKWWAVQASILRHAGSIKVQKTERSLGLMLEFIR